MGDIDLAKKILTENGYALVAVKDGKVIFKSREKGIRPMYILATEKKDITKGASIADRVIGRGAALLSAYLDVKHVYGSLISKGGIGVLEDNHIEYVAGETCEYIKNMDGTDYCPIEKLSIGLEEPLEFLRKLEAFFK